MTYPAAASPLPALPSYTQADILALFDRILPTSYLAPLKEPGPGYEFLQAVAMMTARASTAISHVGTGQYIRSATGGSYSTGTVELYRDSTLGAAIQVQTGTLVGTADGYLYATLADVSFGAGDVGPHSVQVQALVRGWLYDQPGPFTTAGGELIPGPVALLVLPKVAAPVYFDPTLQVRQVSAMTGGSAAMLDGLGYDRGLSRMTGETDAAYRARMMFLPDTVTPAAMRRIIDVTIGDAVSAAGESYIYRELWDLRLMGAWAQAVYNPATDFPKNQTLYFAALNVYVPGGFSSNIFVWDLDQPYVPDQLANRWYGDVNDRGAFYIGLPNIPSMAPNYPLYAGLAQNIEQSRPAGVSVGYIME